MESMSIAENKETSYLQRKNHLEEQDVLNDVFMLSPPGKAKVHKCNLCEKSFTTSPALKRHLHAHSKKKLNSCDICNEIFSSAKSLKQHKANHLKKESPQHYVCPLCMVYFYRKQHFDNHYNQCAMPSKCGFCDKAFSDKTVLLNHCNSHSMGARYNCKYCKICFATSAKFENHQRLHSIKHTKKSKIKAPSATQVESASTAFSIFFTCSTCEMASEEGLNQFSVSAQDESSIFINCDANNNTEDLVQNIPQHQVPKIALNCEGCNSLTLEKQYLQQCLAASNRKENSCPLCDNMLIEKSIYAHVLFNHFSLKGPFKCEACNIHVNVEVLKENPPVMQCNNGASAGSELIEQVKNDHDYYVHVKV